MVTCISKILLQLLTSISGFCYHGYLYFQYVWVLYCDLVCLSYDGNVGDTSVLALLAALQNSKSMYIYQDTNNVILSTHPAHH